MRPSRLPGLLLSLLLLTLACDRPAPEGDPQAFRRLTNLGRAHLENREAAAAIEAFQAALEARAGSPEALRNLARAQLLGRDHEAVLVTLERARQAESGESAASAYLTGLAFARLSRFAEAVPWFEAAVRLDPASAPARFQLANAYQTLERHQETEEQLAEVFRLDPLHATAAFRLARYAAARGDRAAAGEWNRRFAHLRQVLGEAGRSAEELEVSAYTVAEVPGGAGGGVGGGQQSGEGAAPLPVRFTAAGGEAPAGLLGEIQAAAVLEVGPDGRPVVVAVDAAGGLTLLTWGAGGGFTMTPAGRVAPGPGGPGAGLEVRDLAVGNYLDGAEDGADGAGNDLFVLTAAGGRLLRRTADGSFADATAAAGISAAGGERARWADVEQDGDLDLLIAGAAGLAVWRNRGDGGFEEVAAELGAEVAGPVADVAAADLDEDLALDLLAARPADGSLLLAGRREGRFARRPSPPDPLPPARRALLGDLDGDGSGDLVLVGDRAVTLLYPAAGRREELPLAGLTPAAAVLFDFDNDGALDLAVGGAEAGAGGEGGEGVAGREGTGDRDGTGAGVGASGTKVAGDTSAGPLRLWRNLHPHTGRDAATAAGDPPGWADVTAATGLAALPLPALAGLAAADFDADGDSDLLLTASGGGLHLLTNQGGDAHRRLAIRLVGTKTNPTGIGTRVEVIAGAFTATRLVDGPVVEIGVGDRRRLDAVRTVWTNGVVDNEVDLALPDGPLTLVEKNVATGSCPFLYAWDGRAFRFVTDLLGNAPLGLPLRPGEMLPADPEELVLVGGEAALAPRDGTYRLAVTSEFREVLYLDQARLVAIDHPPAVEVGSPDKIAPPPFPPSVPWALARLRPPRSAVGGDGVDRTAAVAAADGVFAPPGRLRPPPYRGVTAPLVLTLDWGAADGDPLPTGTTPVLVLTGWLQYGDASTNIAVAQNPALPSFPPRLEVETAAGWRPLDVTVGLPAGKTKTILVDLAGHLPPGARRLRLVTTHEVRWDRIALAERLPAAALTVHTLPPVAATLAFRGFSELRARRPGHPTTPAWERVSPRPRWRTVLAGWSTRYGDVTELVTATDGRLAVVNAGDSLEIAFDASTLPPLPPGAQRTFAFFSIGWDKDGDPNVAGGDRVEPLPGQEGLTAEAAAAWQARWNTRWVPRDRFARGADASR